MILDKIIYAFPELTLVAGIIHICILRLMSYKSAKIYAFTTRFWLIVSCLLSILFYNKSINAQYFINNAYTLLFILWNNVFIYGLLLVSTYWFITKNHTGCIYYIIILLSACCANLLISSVNLGITLFLLSFLGLINYILQQLYKDKKYPKLKSHYVKLLILMIIIALSGVGYLFVCNNGDLSYQSLSKLYQQKNLAMPLYTSLMSVIALVLYLLNIAPFHITSEESKNYNVLPVAHYMSSVFPIIIWGTLIKLTENLSLGYATELSFAYKTLALLSVAIGALGANVRINLHRIYTESSIYHFGIVLLLVSLFDNTAEVSALIYLLTYLFSLNTAYIMFYNIKSHGTYQSTLSSLSGLAQTRPYSTAALMLCLFSFIGIPPLIGFLGQLNLVNELLTQNLYYILGAVFFFWIILSKAYLEIIKTIYFEKKTTILDTESKFLLLLTMISVALMIILTFNPFNFIEIIKDLFDVIFL